jgi:pilus assembly protein FimV
MKRKRLPSQRGVGTRLQKSATKLRLSSLALAAALTFGLASPDALALALGRISVQSALGEPLRAEIDVPEITPEEVSSLRAAIAAPATFRNQGLEYSASLANVTITLQRRANGSYFLQLASDRPVNEPFVDVVLEASWSSGRIQRDFTMLFDPPALRQPGAPVTAQVSPSTGTPPRSAQPPATAPAAPAPAAPAAAARPAPVPATSPAAPAAAARAPAPAAAARAPAPAPVPSTASPSAPGAEAGKRVTVQSGDTAGKIAVANKPASVSLDQMLIALLRANPDAFVDGNVNRLKAGAVLEMPSGDDAGAVAPDEARQTLVAQSRDFNEFRRRLAEGVPTAAAPATGRQTTGRVQTQVEDKKSATATPDRLTLSKGGIQGKGSSADQIARDRETKEAQARVAELNKNIADLNKLTGSTPGTATGSGTSPGPGISAPPGVTPPAGTAPGTTAAQPASAPFAAGATSPKPVPVPAPAIATAPAPAPAPAPATTVAAATAPAPTPAPDAAATMATPAASAASAEPAAQAASAAGAAASAAAATSTAAAVAAARPAVKRPAPPPEPSLLDEVLENPLVPALGVGLLAVLLGFGFYKMRQKRKTAAVDSSFLESRLQPDSFFGASGGQRIDTAETNNPTGSSMVYSPSQLDAAGDVDPVAEADVYLAYGRDLQAEEILKEALRINPQRVAIHGKLLEIYAKRRDAKAFEAVAADAYNLTQGAGPEWDHICDLGRELDPSNPMYRPGGQPGLGAAAATAAAATAASAVRAPAAPAPAPQVANPLGDVDLDLDFSLGDEPDTVQDAAVPVAPPPPARPAPAPAPVAAAPAPALELPPMEMDFSSPPATAPKSAPARLEAAAPGLDKHSLDFEPVAPVAATKAAPVAAPAAKADMLEFDLGGLSLDLPGSTAEAASPASAAAAKPAAVASPSLDVNTTPAALDLGGDAADADSPLATKLALAEEFNAIGDADGARSLAEEVVAEASGDLKSRAQRLLAEIG